VLGSASSRALLAAGDVHPAHDTLSARDRISPIASRITVSSLTTFLDHNVEPLL